MRGLVVCGVWTRDHLSEFRGERKDSKTTMPSSKKARGRAKKAAKEAKAAEDEVEETTVEVATNQDESLEAQMQVIIGNLLDNSADRCNHGCEIESHDKRLCQEFVGVFSDGYCVSIHAGESRIWALMTAGLNATKGKFASMLNDVAMMEDVVSFLLASGAQNILDGNDGAARVEASFACYFEQHIRVALKRTHPKFDCLRIGELQWADMNTLVNYFRKRIPCKCLDKKYEEVKSINKMGICCNLACSLPNKMAERKKMFRCTGCTGCNSTYYCSAECQKAHWPVHKKYCKKNMSH